VTFRSRDEKKENGETILHRIGHRKRERAKTTSSRMGSREEEEGRVVTGKSPPSDICPLGNKS
jgi:hypothetical protein